MKQLLPFLLILSTIPVLAQDSYFTKKLEYVDNKLVSNIQGTYLLRFEIGSSGYKQVPLFTIYHNNTEQGYLAFLQNEGNMKNQLEFLSIDSYFDTRTSKESMVLSDSNKTKVIIFWDINKRTEYFKDRSTEQQYYQNLNK